MHRREVLRGAAATAAFAAAYGGFLATSYANNTPVYWAKDTLGNEHVPMVSRFLQKCLSEGRVPLDEDTRMAFFFLRLDNPKFKVTTAPIWDVHDGYTQDRGEGLKVELIDGPVQIKTNMYRYDNINLIKYGKEEHKIDFGIRRFWFPYEDQKKSGLLDRGYTKDSRIQMDMSWLKIRHE